MLHYAKPCKHPRRGSKKNDSGPRATHGKASIHLFLLGSRNASVPGVAALLSAPRLGKLGDRIGPEKILITALIFSVLLLIPMSYVQTPLQLGILRFLLGAADGALLPAVQTLLVYNSSNQIAGRIFSYNQSFRDIGNVTGPLMGAAISANYGFRAVFLVTAGVVLFNAVYSWNSLRRRRIPQISN